MFDSVTAAYQGFKLILLEATGLARDALHIHLGLGAFCATRLLWRGRRGWLVAWLVTLVFALTGELFDWRGEAMRGVTVPLPSHWHDIWNTMVWPSILAIVGWRFDPQPRSGKDADQPLEQA
jgi:hypothetical protein